MPQHNSHAASEFLPSYCPDNERKATQKPLQLLADYQDTCEHPQHSTVSQRYSCCWCSASPLHPSPPRALETIRDAAPRSRVDPVFFCRHDWVALRLTLPSTQCQ